MKIVSKCRWFLSMLNTVAKKRKLGYQSQQYVGIHVQIENRTFGIGLFSGCIVNFYGKILQRN